MKASELVSSLRELISQHGDLDTIIDCDAILAEIESVNVLSDPYSQPPVILIVPSQDTHLP